jgi:hypothetical protein
MFLSNSGAIMSRLFVIYLILFGFIISSCDKESYINNHKSTNVTTSIIMQDTVVIGKYNLDSTFTITASNSTIDSIFLSESIFDGYAMSNYEITYSDSTGLFHLQSDGFGIDSSNVGEEIKARFFLALDESNNSGEDLGWLLWGSGGPQDFGFGADVADGETCSGNPCDHCYFKKGGGCGCKKLTIPRRCNHTISK